MAVRRTALRGPRRGRPDRSNPIRALAEQWTKSIQAPQWSPRFGHAVTVFNDRMWILGGYGSRNLMRHTVLGDLWSTVDGGACGRTAARGGNDALTRRRVAVPPAETWASVKPDGFTGQPRFGAGLLAGPYFRLVVFGAGFTGSQALPSNDVWMANTPDPARACPRPRVAPVERAPAVAPHVWPLRLRRQSPGPR